MKVLIIGNIASGKTTLAKRLSDYYNIKYYELDKIVHDDSNNTKREKNEIRKMITEILRQEDYIIEGMLRDNYDLIVPKASSIIFLDYDKKILKKRLKKRYLLQRIGLIKTSYKIDKELYNKLLGYIDNYDKSFLKDIMEKYPNKLIIIKSNSELKRLFEALDERFEL